MKKIISAILVVIATTLVIYACAGYIANPYSSVGVGISGGPYNPGMNPTVRVGVYGGGYVR